MTRSHLREHIDLLVATAHAILWVCERDRQERRYAQEAWNRVAQSPAYAQQNSPPAPELADALDISTPGEDKGRMTPVAWTGIALIIIALLSAIFVSRASLFQQWAIRVVFAIGAAMAASVIPGILNIDISGWVTSGGALAVIVLIYLKNPPKIE